MEEGKGGPQDLPGALALYLESVNYCRDDAWEAMNRLRKQGQPLNEVQTKRYQQLWIASFLKQQRRRLAVREVFEVVNATGEAKNVKLSYRFKSDSGVPQVTMIKGSGDANVDRWIMKAASRITMGDSAPLTDSSGEQNIQAPLIFSPQDTQHLVCCKDRRISGLAIPGGEEGNADPQTQHQVRGYSVLFVCFKFIVELTRHLFGDFHFLPKLTGA